MLILTIVVVHKIGDLMIINADDFGLTHGVNKAIIECYNKGVISQTSIMTNMNYTNEALNLAKKYGIPLRLHFNITQGNSLLDGRQFSANRISELSDYFIEEELKLQLNLLLNNSIKYVGIDCHHNINLINNNIDNIIKKYDNRVRKNEGLCKSIFKQRDVITLLTSLGDKTITEIMVHPGYYDKELEQLTTYSKEREEELNLLLDNSAIIKEIMKIRK